MAQVIPVYTVYSSHDECGARGECLGHFTTRSKANSVSAGQGWYGGNGVVVPGFALRVMGRYYVLAQKEPVILDSRIETLEEIKARALRKLSPAERSALGLNLDDGYDDDDSNEDTDHQPKKRKPEAFSKLEALDEDEEI